MESTAVTQQILTLEQRKQGALLGLFVGDALAMPVHWYYSLGNLKKDYGQILGYTKPHDHLEGSILNLSNTGGGGRGSDKGEIIGTVINHGKKKYWGKGNNYHYHFGL
jgi:ADP-ribosyl-[dinitrogen reductase] hydrolase